MIGLAAVAAMAAMAFVGATSASAASTALCNTNVHPNEELVIDKDSKDIVLHLPCPSGQLATGVSQAGSGELLGTLNIKCDTVNGLGTPLALGNPQQVHISGLDFESCETSESDGCHVLVLEQPLSNLNKTGLDAGTLTATNGRTFVECEDVFGSIDVECEYDAEGLQFSVGAQHLTAEETPVDEIGSDLLCPNEPKLDGLLTNVDHDIAPADTGDTANRYVLA
jgi:hypothetical protein